MSRTFDMASGQIEVSHIKECCDFSADSKYDENQQELALQLLSVAESEEPQPNPRPRPWFC